MRAKRKPMMGWAQRELASAGIDNMQECMRLTREAGVRIRSDALRDLLHGVISECPSRSSGVVTARRIVDAAVKAKGKETQRVIAPVVEPKAIDAPVPAAAASERQADMFTAEESIGGRVRWYVGDEIKVGIKRNGVDGGLVLIIAKK